MMLFVKTMQCIIFIIIYLNPEIDNFHFGLEYTILNGNEPRIPIFRLATITQVSHFCLISLFEIYTIFYQ